MIYESVVGSLMKTMERQMAGDLTHFADLQDFLLLNDSIALLLSVLERGRNYAVVVARGAEIKSATLCHRDERARIT